MTPGTRDDVDAAYVNGSVLQTQGQAVAAEFGSCMCRQPSIEVEARNAIQYQEAVENANKDGGKRSDCNYA